MTWLKALPVLAIAAIFDALRLLFEMFWFFGPAFAAFYCTSSLSDTIGTATSAFLCTAGAGALGVLGAAPITIFGVVMAFAVGLMGWMIIGLILIMTNSRIFTDHPGHSIWFIGSLALSEMPFIGALPAFTSTTIKLFYTQIKNDKAALAKYEKAQADEQKRTQQQQFLQLAQMQQAQNIQDQQQEAANEPYYEQEQAANDDQYQSEEIPEDTRATA